jgi:hypothetical protein
MKNAPRSVTRTWLAPLCLGLTIPLSAAFYGGCKKDEPPPPLPSAAPATTPSAPVELAVEDAGPDVEDASDADADAKKGVGVPTSSMKACCTALAQNAASAPPPSNLYMQYAAQACTAAVAQSKDKSTITGIVSGALKGAQMPAACR